MFDWDEFVDGKIGVRCESLEEYNQFMEYVEGHGVIHREKPNMRSYICDSDVTVVGLDDFYSMLRTPIMTRPRFYWTKNAICADEVLRASEVLSDNNTYDFAFSSDEFFEMINVE